MQVQAHLPRTISGGPPWLRQDLSCLLLYCILQARWPEHLREPPTYRLLVGKPGLQIHTSAWLFHGLQEPELRSSGPHVIPAFRKQKQEEGYKLEFQVSQEDTSRSVYRRLKCLVWWCVSGNPSIWEMVPRISRNQGNLLIYRELETSLATWGPVSKKKRTRRRDRMWLSDRVVA